MQTLAELKIELELLTSKKTGLQIGIASCKTEEAKKAFETEISGINSRIASVSRQITNLQNEQNRIETASLGNNLLPDSDDSTQSGGFKFLRY